MMHGYYSTVEFKYFIPHLCSGIFSLLCVIVCRGKEGGLSVCRGRGGGIGVCVYVHTHVYVCLCVRACV